MKRILIVNATPKRDGVCYSFVQAAKETTEALGVEADVLDLSTYGLNKCLMCNDGWGICRTEHKCIMGEKDGFSKLQQRVARADAFVYATPVYWGDTSEELKIFWDRLRRCEATKQGNGKDDVNSVHKGKPSIIVAVAGGGGGGIVTAFLNMERTINHMCYNDPYDHSTGLVFDYFAINRWNQDYKREAFKAAIAEMVAIKRGEKKPPRYVTSVVK